MKKRVMKKKRPKVLKSYSLQEIDEFWEEVSSKKKELVYLKTPRLWAKRENGHSTLLFDCSNCRIPYILSKNIRKKLRKLFTNYKSKGNKKGDESFAIDEKTIRVEKISLKDERELAWHIVKILEDTPDAFTVAGHSGGTSLVALL